MGETGAQEKLFADAAVAADVAVVSDRCVVRMQGTHRLVLATGVVVAHCAVGDRIADAYAMVKLVERGLGGPERGGPCLRVCRWHCTRPAATV